MKIAGFTRNSFVDYPGRIASVVFFAGCNYDCFFCHNRAIIGAGAPGVEVKPVWEFLEKRQGLLDGVVVTGGEPTLQDELNDFLARVKSLGYLVKLDTNGSRPDAVRALLQAGLVDYVALDIKAPWVLYREYCGANADFLKVLDTLAILRGSGVDYECRTTYLPQLSAQDIELLAKSIAPVKRYALQAYRVPPTYKPTDRFRVMAAGHNSDDIRKALDLAACCGGEVILRA
jgi:pyruvate formate lyase activating enzyme